MMLRVGQRSAPAGCNVRWHLAPLIDLRGAPLILMITQRGDGPTHDAEAILSKSAAKSPLACRRCWAHEIKKPAGGDHGCRAKLHSHEPEQPRIWSLRSDPFAESRPIVKLLEQA